MGDACIMGVDRVSTDLLGWRPSKCGVRKSRRFTAGCGKAITLDSAQEAKSRTAFLHPRGYGGKVRGHEAPARPWSIVCLAALGVPHQEIAKQVNRHFTTVRAALEDRGIKGKPSLRDFGEPVTAQFVRRLATVSSISNRELAELVDIPRTSARFDSTAGGNNRWWGHRRISPRTAGKIVAWRDATVKSLGDPLPRSIGSHRQHRFNRSAILKTLFP